MRFQAQHAAAMAESVARIRAGRAIAASCFGPQLDFVRDKSQLKLAECSRRAGKSAGLGRWLFEGALLMPETVQLYLGITRKSAKRIIWPILKKIDRDWRLGCEFKTADLIVELKNGSEIHVAGCPDASMVDTFRGTPYYRVVVDEGDSFPPSYAGMLIDDALIPATLDYAGSVALAGTPGVAPVGYMWEASTGRIEGWSKHHWTLFDNPHLPNIRAQVEAIIRRRGWTWDHPTVQREYLGKRTADLSMLVYGSYSDALLRDHGPRREDGPWRHTLGLDFGTSEDRESMAYAVVAYSETTPHAWIRETRGEAGATPATCAGTIAELDSVYHFDEIIGDPGSLGADFIKQLGERYRIAVTPAEKSNKRGTIELLNGDMKAGLVLFERSKTAGLVGEMKILPWSDDTRSKEKDKVPNHHCDAALYAWRKARPYDAQPPPDPGPEVGTDEFLAEREELIERKAVEAAQNRRKRRRNAGWWR